MAGFGEDVSMVDFRPSQEDEDLDTGAGHTSDGSVLNVQIAPAVASPTEPSFDGAAAGGEFRISLPSSGRDKVRQKNLCNIFPTFCLLRGVQSQSTQTNFQLDLSSSRVGRADA